MLKVHVKKATSPYVQDFNSIADLHRTLASFQNTIPRRAARKLIPPYFAAMVIGRVVEDRAVRIIWE